MFITDALSEFLQASLKTNELAHMTEILKQSWPWYVGGVLIGLMVPALLILGNKSFGVSASLRDICAACIPSKIPLLDYDWKKEAWNLFFAAGIIIGGFIGGYFFGDPQPETISSNTLHVLAQNGVQFNQGFVPENIFNWSYLISLPGFIIMVVGGFLVGFGTRYAGGCTSGHGIMGLSTLQWPSLLAIISFFIGGIISANWILPYVLNIGK